MKVIWKYPIPQSTLDPFRLELPQPFKVVDVAVDELGPSLWIQHDRPDAACSICLIEFHIIGTCHEHPDDFIHQGTYRVGPFVWHIMASRGILL